jgi:hypothetical protein
MSSLALMSIENIILKSIDWNDILENFAPQKSKNNCKFLILNKFVFKCLYLVTTKVYTFKNYRCYNMFINIY